MNQISQTQFKSPKFTGDISAFNFPTCQLPEKQYWLNLEKPLYNSLNCNRIALQCLKIKGNNLSESVMMMAVEALLRWFDQHLDNPLDVVESKNVRTITLFNCIHYIRNDKDGSFSGYISYEKPKPEIQYAIVTLRPFLATHQWMKPVLHQAIPMDYLKEIKQNTTVYNCLAKETAKLLSNDHRFKTLKEQQIHDAVDIDQTLLKITDKIFTQQPATSEDLTLIKRNKDVYHQLLKEKNPLIKFFHAANMYRYYQLKTSLGYTGTSAGKVLPQHSAKFSLAGLRDMILDSHLSLKAWRYIYQHGDELFDYIWQLQPAHKSRFKVAMKYLEFLANNHYPSPPSPIIIKSLLNMQGYEDGNDTTFSSNWRELNTPVIEMALHYYGQQKEISYQHIDDLLLVAYQDLDCSINLDKNQKKRGWPWLVNKCRLWQNQFLDQVKMERHQWTTTLGEIKIDKYWIKEIKNEYELFCTASQMRNCLNNYDDKCDDNVMRFFNVYSSDQNQSEAVIGLGRDENGWQLDDIRGFANGSVSPELKKLGSEVEKLYNQKYMSLVNGLQYHRVQYRFTHKISV